MKRVLFFVVCIGLAFSVFGQNERYFEYKQENGGISIIGYHRNFDENVVIPEKINGLPVISIEAKAFSGKRLNGIVIPDSVTTIGDGAFALNRLTNVVIPDSVTTIGDKAFANNQLTSVVIPDSVIAIGYGVFSNNSAKNAKEPFSIMVNKNTVTIIGYNRNETAVIIPEEINGLSVTTIGDRAFYGSRDHELTNVTIPSSVTAIEDYAFMLNQLSSVIIPNSVVAIGNGAFQNNQLTSVTISSSVATIGDKAFANNQLTSVVIPDSVTTIGRLAFRGNRLTAVTIPNSVIELDERAFDNGVRITME